MSKKSSGPSWRQSYVRPAHVSCPDPAPAAPLQHSAEALHNTCRQVTMPHCTGSRSCAEGRKPLYVASKVQYKYQRSGDLTGLKERASKASLITFGYHWLVHIHIHMAKMLENNRSTWWSALRNHKVLQRALGSMSRTQRETMMNFQERGARIYCILHQRLAAGSAPKGHV